MTSPSRAARLISLSLALAILSTLFGPTPAGPPVALAATITVNTLEDSFVANGNCSLREAISSANLNVAFDACTAGTLGADTINISVPGTITLQLAGKNEDNNATGDLDIFETVTINGQGAVLGATPTSGTTINGNAVDRVFEIFSGAQLTLNDLQVREGNPSSGGSNGGGGNIFSNGGLELNRVVIANGFAGNGGGAFIAGGTPFTAVDSHFSDNIAMGQPLPIGGGSGGALFLDFNTVTTMQRVSFIQNTASTVGNSGTRGGAIYNNGNAGPLVNIQFDGNQATDVFAAARGGAIFNDATLQLISSTITNNALGGLGPPSGGGIFTDSGTTEVSNTILAFNHPNNCGQNVTFFGNNLEDGTSCGFIGAGQLNANPVLGSLVTGGSQVQVRQLNAGSPAIDAAVAIPCPGVDARNVGRPIDGDGNGPSLCDIGAFEASFSPGSSPSPSPSADGEVTNEADKPNDDDIVRSRRQTEDQRRQKERTNRGGHDDYSCEGNVVEVHPEAAIPYVVIANRDGLVKVLLIREAASSAKSIKVGDYLEADGVKEHEYLFEADSVSITKR